MGNRMMKDSIHDSEDVAMMTDFEFRLWVNLITYVDDYGRGDARPAIIKGKCFPLRDAVHPMDIAKGLEGLEKIGCIKTYEADGKKLFYFPKWETHQRIRQKHSKYPDPCGNLRQSAASGGNSRPEQEQELELEQELEVEQEQEQEHEPTLADVVSFGFSINPLIDARKFYDQYKAAGWKDHNGQQIRNWRGLFISWERSVMSDGRTSNSRKSEDRFGHLRYDNERGESE